MDERALTCRSLLDPHGAIATLKAASRPFPEPLRDALLHRFGWEAGFAVDNARLAAQRREQTHVAGCAHRALCCVVQALFALNGRCLINETGAVGEAATFPITIPGLADMQAAIWQAIGAGELDKALRRLQGVADALRTLL